MEDRRGNRALMRRWLPPGASRVCALAVLAVLAVATATAQAAGRRPAASIAVNPDELLAQTLLDISANQLDQALRRVEALIQQRPNFRLAHLIRGDLLMARAKPLSTLGNVASGNAERGEINDLRDEARARLKNYVEGPPLDRLPKALLKLDPRQRHAVVVDLASARLYLYEQDNGEVRLARSYYVTSGKQGADKWREGDQKTPLGVYFVSDDLPRAKLGDFYGSGAYPIDYPNAWDKRLGRDGHGIWLHGVPADTYSRPPRASNGCVVLSNRDMTELGSLLKVGVTPVIIGAAIDWADPRTLAELREGLTDAVETWRRDWESLDVERYLDHYAASFKAGEQDRDDWARAKRQVSSGKTSIRVGMENLSMFLYPGNDSLAVVSFEQDYQSNNLNDRVRKRQYWLKEPSGWKIIAEQAS
jgi:murein L,D-transpeptidase YafK